MTEQFKKEVAQYDFQGSIIRLVNEGDEVLFCGRDVAVALGYANPAKAVLDHCRVSKGVPKAYPSNRRRNAAIHAITEVTSTGLSLTRNFRADKFERWVFDEVLPSIRKHGGYLTPERD